MKLVVTTFVSLDGVMQGPGGPEEDPSNGFDLGGWVIPLADQVFGEAITEWMSAADAVLLGRNTYQAMQAYWESVTDPDNMAATKLNGTKYLVSTTVTDPTWANTTVISKRVVERIRELKASGDGELQVHGSHGLVQTLNVEGLVDEYRIIQFPVILGQGKRLFENGHPGSALTLVSSRPTTTGALVLVYRPAGDVATGTATVENGKEA